MDTKFKMHDLVKDNTGEYDAVGEIMGMITGGKLLVCWSFPNGEQQFSPHAPETLDKIVIVNAK